MLRAALAAVGVPMLLLAVVYWPAVAIVLVALTGAGAILVEIMTETALQRTLPPDVFGRAYGLALPASLAGIVAGSLIAPVLASVLGTDRCAGRLRRGGRRLRAAAAHTRPRAGPGPRGSGDAHRREPAGRRQLLMPAGNGGGPSRGPPPPGLPKRALGC